MSTLKEIVRTLQSFEGITRKYVIPTIIRKLREVSYRGGLPHSLGEDSATIGTEYDEYVLLTTDSVMEGLCLQHPHAAGFNVVLANVMDIYAAGGIPTSFAVALSYSDPAVGEHLLQGVIDASHAFRVPVVRGHTNPSASCTYIVGAATGTVKVDDVLTAGGATEGDYLIMLFDSKGHRGVHYHLGWDTVTRRSSDDNIQRLSVMTHIAQEHLANAAKDISTAGVIGTAGMMVEYSGRGGVVNLDAIDQARPPDIPLKDWVRMFISLGFLIATDKSRCDKIQEIASEHGLVAPVIGRVDSSRSLRLVLGAEEQVVFDFSDGPLLTPRNTMTEGPS